jgi:hypothetical protein
MSGPDKMAVRYAMQTLALHKALALLRMYLTDPKLAPSGVEEAVRELEIATEPLRYVPVPRVKGQTKADRDAERQKERRRADPEKYDKFKRDEKIKRRMAAGMTREMAEAHADSGSRLSPRGYDMDAEDYDPALDLADEDEFPPIPTVSVDELRRRGMDGVA